MIEVIFNGGPRTNLMRDIEFINRPILNILKLTDSINCILHAL